MAKTIVVGIGGTGFEVIRSLRKRIVEANPKIGLAAYPNLGFLYIDTDKKEMEFDAKKILGQDISLRDSERILVKAPDAVGRVLDDLDAFPNVKAWLPIEKLKGMDASLKNSDGAGQIRALGRMIFTLSADKVKHAFLNAYGRLRQEAQEEPQVFLACSLSGGTGGGMFIDLGYSVRHWLANHCLTTSYLILPDLTRADRDQRYLANAYGALMDLNYYSLAEKHIDGRTVPNSFTLYGEGVTIELKPPFDDCYLLGTQNQDGVTLDLDAIPDMVAHRIYLSLDREIDRHVRGLLNNAGAQRGVYLFDPISRSQFSQNFLSFGLAAITSPTEEIKEIVVYQMLEDLLTSWVDVPAVPNVNQEVHKHLTSHQLVDAYLLANQDVFGKGANHGDIEEGVDRQLGTMLGPEVEKKPRGPKLNDVFNNFLPSFRGGLDKYYDTAEANKNGAADVLAGNVRSYICRSIVRPELGLPYAKAYTQELIGILGAKKQEYITKESLDKKIKTAEAHVAANIGKVTEAEGQMMFSERDANRALVDVRQSMSLLFKARAQKRAYHYGQLLLDLIIQRLEELAVVLDQWQGDVEAMRERAKRERDAVKEHLKTLQKNTHLVNGRILFDDQQLAEIIRAVPSAQILAHLNEVLAQGDSVLEIRSRIDASLERGYSAAVAWINEHANHVISGKNIAQKLLENYPGQNNPERTELLRISARKSSPFLAFDAGEMNIYSHNAEARYNKYDMNAHFQLAGVMDSDDGQRREVVQIREDLVLGAQISPGAIRTISDTNQIIFISETTAFPLRLLSILKRLKEDYRKQNNQGFRSLPLLMSKSYNPPIGDIQLITQTQSRQSKENEENFVLAWVGRDLRLEENKAERRHEVRLYYRDEVGQERFATLGSSRDDVFETWRSFDNDNESEKKILADLIHSRVRSWKGIDDRLPVGAALDKFLDEIANSEQFGKESLNFQRYQNVVSRLKEKYDLYRKFAAGVSQPNIAPAAPMNGNEGSASEFRAYVADLLDRKKGVLSEMLRASIERHRKELGLSDATAEKILREEQSVYGKPEVEPTPEERYRQLVSAKLAKNLLLSPDDEDELLDFEVRSHISEEAARRIRSEVETALR